MSSFETEQGDLWIYPEGSFSNQWERNRLLNYSTNGIGTICYALGRKVKISHTMYRNGFYTDKVILSVSFFRETVHYVAQFGLELAILLQVLRSSQSRVLGLWGVPPHPVQPSFLLFEGREMRFITWLRTCPEESQSQIQHIFIYFGVQTQVIGFKQTKNWEPGTKCIHS
jgi:hypothetical protein